MYVTYHKLDVRTSELQNARVEVPAWEAPVLQAVHGENVVFVSDSLVERDAPDAADEFRRLGNKYRGEADDPPFVAAVYGQFGPGIAALKTAIDAATTNVATVSEEEAAQIDVAAGVADPELAGLL